MKPSSETDAPIMTVLMRRAWQMTAFIGRVPVPAKRSRDGIRARFVVTRAVHRARNHSRRAGPPFRGRLPRRPAPGEQRALSTRPIVPPPSSPHGADRRQACIRPRHGGIALPPTTTPAKRKRGEGQWKLGHREPLNPNERTKKDDNGLNVRARIENIYAHRGFDSIDPADLRGRFRWWGLYTQRKPGIDGGKTATLEPEELDDRYFMLRIRIDGGALTTDQLTLLGEISQHYARDTADITDRQNVQYHWIEIE